MSSINDKRTQRLVTVGFLATGLLVVYAFEMHRTSFGWLCVVALLIITIGRAIQTERGIRRKPRSAQDLGKMSVISGTAALVFTWMALFQPPSNPKLIWILVALYTVQSLFYAVAGRAARHSVQLSNDPLRE